MSVMPTLLAHSQLPPEQLAVRARCVHPTGTFVDSKEEEVEQSIPQRFEKIVAKFQNHVAVKTSKQTLTYEELNHAANRLAYVILKRRGKENERVALLMEQSASLIAAMLGILKAGKTYVPLDCHYPQARLASILQDSQPTLMVTNNRNLSLARQLVPEAFRITNIDEIESNPGDRDPNGLISPEPGVDHLYFRFHRQTQRGYADPPQCA